MERNERNTKKIIKKLIGIYGSKEAVAVTVGKTGTYIQMMQKGTVPSDSLFEKLVGLTEEIK